MVKNNDTFNKKKFLDINLHGKKVLDNYKITKVDKKKDQLYK